jgi:hypothetical protein
MNRLLLLAAVITGCAWGQAAKPTPESAVHKHARMELAQLIQAIQKMIDWKPGGECNSIGPDGAAVDGKTHPCTIDEELSDHIKLAEIDANIALEAAKCYYRSPCDPSELSLNNLSQKTDLFKKLLAAQDELSVLTTKLRYVDICASVYRKTIDKKAGDMTLRDSEQVSECRSLDLYPPAK